MYLDEGTFGTMRFGGYQQTRAKTDDKGHAIKYQAIRVHVKF